MHHVMVNHSFTKAKEKKFSVSKLVTDYKT